MLAFDNSTVDDRFAGSISDPIHVSWSAERHGIAPLALQSKGTPE